MQMCQGDLKRRISQARAADHPCSVQAFLRMLDELAVGLIDLHSKEVMYGDLKPDNLLIGPAGQLLFADFGDARDLRMCYKDRSVHELGWGSPNYHARPDVMKCILSAASDMWMLAQTMIHIWTRQEATTNPSVVPEDIPLRSQLESCFSPNPEDRPSPEALRVAVSGLCHL